MCLCECGVTNCSCASPGSCSEAEEIWLALSDSGHGEKSAVQLPDSVPSKQPLHCFLTSYCLIRQRFFFFFTSSSRVVEGLFFVNMNFSLL